VTRTVPRRSLAAAALVLLGTASAQLTTASDAVRDELVETCERAVLARIGAVTRVRGVDVASVAVERAFVGPEEEATLHVLALDPAKNLLATGERYVLFLERDPSWLSRSERVRESLAALTGGGVVLATMPGGRLRFAAEPDGGILESLGVARTAPRFDAGAVLAELQSRIAARLPIVEAHFVSTGPRNWGLRVDAARSTSATAPAPECADGADARKVRDACWKRLWREIDERFLALPDEIGRSSVPDAPSREIVVRTSRGPKRIRLNAWDPQKAADPLEREQIERALRVWQALAALDSGAP